MDSSLSAPIHISLHMDDLLLFADMRLLALESRNYPRSWEMESFACVLEESPSSLPFNDAARALLSHALQRESVSSWAWTVRDDHPEATTYTFRGKLYDWATELMPVGPMRLTLSFSHIQGQPPGTTYPA